MNVFVLMTAMPPTLGHLQLIQFANRLRGGWDRVQVLVCTQPFEPFPRERVQALRLHIANHPELSRVEIRHYDKEIEQDPSTPGFWDMWKEILISHGVDKNTTVVASEPYGKQVADLVGAKFMPYDLGRQIYPAKAEYVREAPWVYFDQIIPEFQDHLRTTVTIFGAESTGKTTLAKRLADHFSVPWLFEYARPYLESNGPEITVPKMEDIWRGQYALQKQGERLNAPLVIQDTDLFSTIGYWAQPHWQKELGEPDHALVFDALRTKSDLYLILPSDIPFEEDPIRYGGDRRESPDSYWIELAEKYSLPYVILEDRGDAYTAVWDVVYKKLRRLRYDRKGL